MIYKIQDWIIENYHRLNWGIIFAQCDKYNLIENYWDYFINYAIHSNIIFDNDAEVFSYETTLEYMSENANSFQVVSSSPIYWKRLSLNPAAIRLIEQNLDKADWSMVSKNTAAIPLLKKHFDKIDWTMLSENPNADELLLSNMNYVNMYHLCSYNPNVVNIVNIMLENDPEVIHLLCWYSLSINPMAVPILEKYPFKINWDVIVRNMNAFHLIKKYSHLISDLGWEMLSRNPYATAFLRQFPDKVRQYEGFIDLSEQNETDSMKEEDNWQSLSQYSEDTEYLRQNIEHIDWYSLSSNPSIYVYDYQQMKINMDVLRKELIQKALHPTRVIKWIELGCDDMLE